MGRLGVGTVGPWDAILVCGARNRLVLRRVLWLVKLEGWNFLRASGGNWTSWTSCLILLSGAEREWGEGRARAGVLDHLFRTAACDGAGRGRSTEHT